MKLLAVAVCLVLALAAEAYEPIFSDYHQEIGIPEAARIKKAEEAMDFDGNRITGGTASRLGQFPFMAGLAITLTTGGTSVCGATLLTNSAASTAAHCWRHGNTQARQFTVVLGSMRLFSGGTRINTNNVQMHGSYNQNNLNNDVAVIRMSHVNFNANINRIAMATGSDQFVGALATAVGYGRTSDTAGISQNQILSHVNLQVTTNAVCSRTYGAATVIGSTLCVATSNGRSTCGGDSGGPLVFNSRLIGITSFGHRNGCTLGFPAGFARVTSFVSWFNARI